MNYLERVKQAMDFYKQNNIGPGWRQDSMVSINYPLMWAEDAARREGQENLDFSRSAPQDFFGSSTPEPANVLAPYRAPARFDPSDPTNTPPADMMSRRAPASYGGRPPRASLNSGINNYLATLLGGR